MGLNWLSILRKRRAVARQNEVRESTTCEIDRILFIGFGKVPGFHCFNWEDWNWLNASDFEMVFINCGPLYGLLHRWKQKHSEDEASFSEGPFDQLREKLSVLREQVLQIIDSDRSVFALATPDVVFHLGSGYGYRSAYVYSWCPLPVEIHDESGEVIRDIDLRFSEYRKQIKEWTFSFDSKPKQLEYMDRNDLSHGQSYVLLVQGLFENLSLHPLGVELRYGVYDQAARSVLPDVVSGPIYLLHYPIRGDLRESLRCLLREFCNTDLVESDEPEWVQLIKPPRGTELDEQINFLSSQIEQLSEQKMQLVAEKQQLEYWRKLLYETGDMLEDVVFEALKLLGLDNVQFGIKGDHDIVGELDGKTLLFEVKGLNKSAGRKEVFDLDRHIGEFGLKNPGKKVAKGVLVANAYRDDPPDTREESGKQIFAGDAVDHAKLLEFALLDTRVLYRLVTDVIEGKLDDTSEVLQSLRETIGIYSY
jgi:hypothetical protein